MEIWRLSFVAKFILVASPVSPRQSCELSVHVDKHVSTSHFRSTSDKTKVSQRYYNAQDRSNALRLPGATNGLLPAL